MTFMAHPDDAEILCAGTLVRLADLGWEVHIATCTAGDCGTISLPPDEIAAVRRQEAQRAAELIGATYHCLEEMDAQVVFDKPTNRQVIEMMRRIAPTLLFTHPRHDYMLDHEQAHLLARSAAFSHSMANASPSPVPDGARIPWLYYSDPIDGRDPYTGQLITPTTYVPVTDQLPRKTEMLACHASQREWLRAHHGMDEYIDSMRRWNAMRGGQIGVEFAEPFVQHRGHPFPDNDLLQELFGTE